MHMLPVGSESGLLSVNFIAAIASTAGSDLIRSLTAVIQKYCIGSSMRGLFEEYDKPSFI